MNKNLITELFATQFNKKTEDIDVQSVYGFVSISDEIMMPIVTSNIFDKSHSIQIDKEDYSIIGEIYFLSNKKHELNSLPETLYKIYLSENETLSVVQPENYQFKFDYLVVNTSKAEEYFNNYKQTSFVWGDYYHIESAPIKGFSFNTNLTKLTAIEGLPSIKFQLNQIHKELISETNCFHRFLKYYQLLETYFDMHTAEKISTLFGLGGKEKEISSLLRDYNREDMNRLISLIKYFVETATLEKSLPEIFEYMGYAKEIFFTFGKTSNPLPKYQDLERIKNKGNFLEASLQTFRGSNTHADFLSKITSYWIYRIRSSIAHRKLGEYIMDSKDEKFIINFAEPLIKNIYRDFFRKMNH